MPKTSPAKPHEPIRRALLSIGVGKKSVETLVKNKALDDIVVPIYWKDGIVSKPHNGFLLKKLPEFLRSFRKEFPDGEVRWDSDYDEEGVTGATSDVAIRVFFDYQEDDQGDHWSPKPTELEAESYQRMLARYSHKGSRPAPAQSVLRAK